jgi:hypothetical protein
VGGLVRTLGGGLEPGNGRDAPAQLPTERLLGFTPQVADVPEHLGVSLFLLSNAFGKGGPFAAHSASPPFHGHSGQGLHVPDGANDSLLAAPISYSRSFGDRRRWASRARASPAEAP